MLGPGVAGDVVAQTVVPDVSVRVPPSTQQHGVLQGVRHRAGPGNLQLEGVGLHQGVAHVVGDQDVDTLPARQEILARVAAPDDDGRERLLSTLDTAAGGELLARIQ